MAAPGPFVSAAWRGNYSRPPAASHRTVSQRGGFRTESGHETDDHLSSHRFQPWRRLAAPADPPDAAKGRPFVTARPPGPSGQKASKGAALAGSQRDLFEASVEAELSRRAPLATRMRPTSLDEVVGQRHLVACGAPLRLLVEADSLSSAVFYGPPGSGKTTVARLIAGHTARRYRAFSAVDSGVREVRAELEGAREALGQQGIGTILFLDEVHRFSKAQQDALLHGIEEGVIVLIGATTENPFFSLNAPLLSRSTLWRFDPLGPEEVMTVARRALIAEGAEAERGALERLADLASGDARVALTVLEVATELARRSKTTGEAGSPLLVSSGHVEQARAMRAFRHGREDHYNLASAFIKSVRGSDPDAGLYWLARMLAVGEDPRFVARRLVILASEDIGMADPTSLVVASAAAQAVELVGLPEASLNLSQATIHLALAPKSNTSATALWKAVEDVSSGAQLAVPPHLRSANYRGAASVGSGSGYEYPHDDERGWLAQRYLPDELGERSYYVPSLHGVEGDLARKWQERRREDEDTSR
ncbi:MAG: replication-associated recombination protein A [Acidimicrobiales bacterium]